MWQPAASGRSAVQRTTTGRSATVLPETVFETTSPNSFELNMQMLTGMSFRSKASFGHSTYRRKLKRKAAMIWSSDCALALGTTRRHPKSVATTTPTDTAARRRKARLLSLARGTLLTPEEKGEASTAESIGISTLKKNPPRAELRQLRGETLIVSRPERTRGQ